MTAHQDTIAAIATPAGSGGVGIVRISGPAATTMATQISGLRTLKPRFAHHATFSNAKGQVIDSGLLLFFQGPASFTGEDVIELQGHGGQVVMNMLLQAVIQLGARLARPGEFSERAFLNDKIDLVQAEAIADVIASGSEQAVLASQRSLQGAFSRHIDELLEKLIETRVWVESAIDFPEEEIDFLSDVGLQRQLAALNQMLLDTLRKTQTGVVLSQGISIAIIGRPNAGKSSLLNRLTEADSAIISEVAGTTRDVVKEDVVIAGIPVRLIDTAGIHETDNPIEQQGIERALLAKAQADVVLQVWDGSEYQGQPLPVAANQINIINKSDLVGELTVADALVVSAKHNTGIDAIRQAIVDRVTAGDLNENSFTARQRHIEQLHTTQQHLAAAERQLHDNQGELSAEELRLGQQALSEITGAFSSDDLLGEIFSRFCIGK
ncbi:tRNA uridine-5-carboxymethylaminomethyl(34) synthesis GTPase MnmE [Marinicella meishanensis]|uniref:tRNA uridine-5-carboxymethylaminomethyl(34) synthesis GTPase MnmE n=1 Tax=Marinicella meishanensis TaxID=2873263 RepID=UPI001CBC6A2F|nr:tRNA uridine-5-carboxymethylaminomethyl(34) synthesis GTPase MnmE [Marinicella sp. NBU2979]